MSELESTLVAWKSIPQMVGDSVAGLDDAALDRRDETGGMTIRENVYHIAEANLVAASIVVAALGKPGCVYDWSWMMPFGAWLKRLGYASMPVAPAVKLLEAINEYVALLAREPEKLDVPVQLRDSPQADLRRVSVADVLLQEVQHAEQHTQQIRTTRSKHGLRPHA